MILRRVAPFLLSTLVFGQTVDKAFFEAKIRPVLVQKCFGCHSSKLKAPMGGLVLDTKAGTQPALGKLVEALSYTNPHMQMPPSGKLPDNVITDFRQWVEGGAPDPRIDSGNAPSVALRGMPIEQGKKWWAFQPLPKVADKSIDQFLLAKLQDKNLRFSAPADKRTLVKRLYVDIVGYKPSYAETEAFVNDPSPTAYEDLVDKLLASPHYGERWARHWMDVARYAEDNPTSEATNPPYPFAWRYRDWIIEALNKDLPYDRFVKMQLAADKMPDAQREDLRALGYLGAAPVYHKDLRISADVIGGFLEDDWDERVDAVTRGVMGLTVACARCHDHKFDPILTKDYYSLVGVFASTMRAERPLFDVDPQVETHYLWAQNRLFDLRYSVNLLTNEASTVVGSEQRVARWKAEIEQLKTQIQQYEEKYPKLVSSVAKYWTFAPPPKPGAAAGAGNGGRRRGPPASTEPFANAVFDAAQYVQGSDANYTMITYHPGEVRDHPILLHGNVATPGEVAPRQFLTVLSQGDSRFRNGSGRLELADRMFSDAAPLSARVIVNRVWEWHFGKPLVGTPSDFGTQGEKPTHPELLDALAAQFVAHGWSLKWLNRELVLTEVYRQSSQPQAEGLQADPANALLWRMNPRRLDVESYRDTLLRVTGQLDEKMFGIPEDVDSAASVRRTIYGRVSRGRLSTLFRLYDFPDPSQTAPNRELTTSSLQQLFVMNGAFLRKGADAVADSLKDQTDNKELLRSVYQKLLSREPSPAEMDLGLTFLAQGSLAQYAHVMLSSNELIFWP